MGSRVDSEIKAQYHILLPSNLTLSSDPNPARVINEDGEEGQVVQGEVLHYNSIVKYTIEYGGLEGKDSSKTYITGLIPAGSQLVEGSINVTYTGSNGSYSKTLDRGNPSKLAWEFNNIKQGEKVTIEYTVKVIEIKGVLKNYATSKTFDTNGTDILAAVETKTFIHNIEDIRTKVTVTAQKLVDKDGTPISEIYQNTENGLEKRPVNFVITISDNMGNEYNGQMEIGTDAITFYGLEYNVEYTVTEIGTLDTKFRETSLADNKFILQDTTGGREVSFTITSEYQVIPGFFAENQVDDTVVLPNREYTDIKDYELDWLASIQLDNGAIPIGDDKLRADEDQSMRYPVRPYFALSAAIALTEDNRYYENVKRYIEWHFAHINMTPDVDGLIGTIYDYGYDLSGKERIADTVYDSIDSYASLFFDLLNRYYNKVQTIENSSEKAYYMSVFSSVNLDILDIIVNMSKNIGHDDVPPGSIVVDPDTQQNVVVTNPYVAGNTYYMTLCKVSYPIAYLMDNVEMYRGYKSLANLYTSLGMSAKATSATDYMNRVERTINDKFWNEAKGDYDYAYSPIHGNYVRKDQFYPGATSQLLTITSGIISPQSDRAKKMYKDFIDNFPTWTDMYGDPSLAPTPAQIEANPNAYTPHVNYSGYPWTMVAHSAAIMGDLENLDIAFKSIDTRYRQTGNFFPFLCHEAGSTVEAILVYREQYSNIYGEMYPDHQF